MLFFSVFEVVGFAANISRAEICPFFDLELDALTLLKKTVDINLKKLKWAREWEWLKFNYIQLLLTESAFMSTKILFLWIVREIPKGGENQWLQAVVILQGKYQSVSLKGIVLYLSQY